MSDVSFPSTRTLHVIYIVPIVHCPGYIRTQLSISLQMCDQYTYDNVFVYFQPGNGKVKLKEPLDMATKAMSQLKEVLDFVESSQ